LPSRRSRRSGAWFDEAAEGSGAGEQPEVCALCARSIPPHARSSRHHLTPKLKGGAKLGTVRLHQICHSAIHARYTEAELARRLCDVESLRAEPEIARFLDWIATRPADFHAPTRMTARRRAERPRR
jgi:5-methylcytosine-specific restriction protein A